MLRAFFGHHKAANSWVRSVLRDACVALNLDLHVVHHPRDWAGYHSLGDWVRAKRPSVIALTNARIEDVRTLPEFKAFHVIRDPRDILVSGYFSHRNSHPVVLPVGNATWEELPAHRERLHELDQEAGLLAEIDFSAHFIDSVATWDYQRSDTLELKMEDLTADPHRHWPTIFAHLDMIAGGAAPAALAMAAVKWNLAQRRKKPRPVAALRRVLPAVPLTRLPAAYVPWVVERYSFAVMSGGRASGVEDVNHHYRRGVAGDWRNHLTDRHLAAFRERFGDVAQRLGYQQD